ncbi:hypothetical protein NN561_011538 [Cricetulus griseus]
MAAGGLELLTFQLWLAGITEEHSTPPPPPPLSYRPGLDRPPHPHWATIKTVVRPGPRAPSCGRAGAADVTSRRLCYKERLAARRTSVARRWRLWRWLWLLLCGDAAGRDGGSGPPWLPVGWRPASGPGRGAWGAGCREFEPRPELGKPGKPGVRPSRDPRAAGPQGRGRRGRRLSLGRSRALGWAARPRPSGPLAGRRGP